MIEELQAKVPVEKEVAIVELDSQLYREGEGRHLRNQKARKQFFVFPPAPGFLKGGAGGWGGGNGGGGFFFVLGARPATNNAGATSSR